MPDLRARRVGMAPDVAAPGADERKGQLGADVARWLKRAQQLDIQPPD